MSAGISCITLALCFYIYISLKGQTIAEVTRIGADRLTDKEREERKLIKKRTLALQNFNDPGKISYI